MVSQKKYSRNRILATVLAMILIIVVTIVSLLGVHSRTEDECWENLRSAAKSADAQMAMLVDNTFAYLENSGEMLAEFGDIGGPSIAEEVSKTTIGNMRMEMRLYLPDGKAFTASGTLDNVSSSIDYSGILGLLDADGRYVSCVKKDLANPDMLVMEYFVPVVKDGRTVALASAVMDTGKLQNQISSSAYGGETRIYYLDTRDGMMFFDNDHQKVYPVTAMSDRVDKDGKSIQPYIEGAMSRQETSVTVMSERYNVPALMFSIPSEANENWEVTLVVRESTAFAAETNVRNVIILLTAVEIGVLVLFLIWLLFSMRREKAAFVKSSEEKQKVLADNLEESLTFTNYFLSTYVAAYYVGLDDCSCQIYKRTEALEREFPVIDNYYELLKAYINSVVHPDDRQNLIEILAPEKLRGILKEASEYSSYYRDISTGSEQTIRLQVIRGADENHAAIGFVNVTKELEKQRELTRRTVLSEYFLSSYSTAYYLDLTNNEYDVLKTNGIIADMAKGDETIGNGAKFDTLVSVYIDGYVHPDDKDKVRTLLSNENIRRRFEADEEINFTFRDVADHEPGIYRGTVIRGEDADHAGIGFKNITEEVRQQEEEQHQLAEALAMAESANRAKTTFLNNMSHDIRTPMNAIIGYTGLAASHIDNKQQVQDYLAKIAQSSDHLLSLINDVLDMSRIESGKMNLEEAPENLSDIIHTLRDIVQADIHSKQLEFFVDAVDVNDEGVICDKLRLNQVLLNILSNAIKYTPAGGTVTMRVAEKAVKASGYATYEFRIKDNGMGMDEEFLGRIYDPFTRVSTATVTGIQGTGLGMAITKNIIDMMGGEIDIQSEPAKGTEVTITFDFKLQSAPKAPEQIPELAGVRALVADDDSNTCLSICKMVRDIGMRSEWCTSGKETVIRAEAAHQEGDAFRVYIIDWIMPDMNGIETTRRIRHVIGDDAPIIILTAYDWSDIEEEAREAGVTAFVSKPMFPSDLHRVLNRCLGKEDAQAATQKATDAFDFTGKRILLVEDNELNREIATEILEEEGFIVETAEDGDLAVERMFVAQPGDFDLILMDIQMPHMDGYEATRQIRSLDTKISRIPILAMTANAFEEDRKAAFEAGMDEHIAKPIDIDMLKETLAKFLR